MAGREPRNPCSRATCLPAHRGPVKVAVVHNEPLPGKPDSQDVLNEVRLVALSLEELGLPHRIFGVDGRPGGFMRALEELTAYGPAVVFNLVEGIGDDPRLSPAMASCFDLAGFPYTGSPFEALIATTDKFLTKAVLSAHGIPTPAWQKYCGEGEPIHLTGPLIAKPAWEDASVGIDDESVFFSPESVLREVHERFVSHQRQPFIIEEFIDGREFNVSLLEHPDGRVEVLPLAEMSFREWPPGKPRILNYRAKWVETSFEYTHTRRQFDSAAAAAEAITSVALRCWRSFGLRGYARVDLRLDPRDAVHVIEVNTNPCIAPDSGFMAAARQGRYLPRDIVETLIMTAMRERR